MVGDQNQDPDFWVKEELEDGFYTDISNERYHYALTSRPSRSGLMTLLNGTPADFHWERSHPKPVTEAMNMGSAVDAAVTEPLTFHEKFTHYPLPVNRSVKKEETARAKGVMTAAEAEEFEQQHPGKTILKDAEEFEQAAALAEAVLGHPAFMAMAEGATQQATMLYTDPVSGVATKVRPDLISVDKGIVIDIKTTSEMTQVKRRKSITRLGYEIQAAMTRRACSELGIPWFAHVLVWIRTAKGLPPQVKIEYLDEWWLERGDLLTNRALRIYRECSESGVWPGLPVEISLHEKPTWGDEWMEREMKAEQAAESDYAYPEDDDDE